MRKMSCNDDTTSFIFHMNEAIAFGNFRRMAGR